MKFDKYINELILGLIVVVAAYLRFYNYAELSISGDEVSVLHRLQFNTLKEVVDLGVRPDGHPAGVQVLMYFWTKVFGITEASIRFPFVISGIFVVVFSYLIPAYSFNKTVGLYCAATMCFLQFPLIYSQIARPYSPGLLFTLMSAWFWHLLLFRPNTRLVWKVVGYTLTTTLAIYMHYFSFFQVIVIGLTGFIFLNKRNYKGYVISAFFIFILFLPHFDISLGHLRLGGLREAGWLGSPSQEDNWFLRYIFFLFNNSYSVLAVLFSILFISLYHIRKKIALTKHHAIYLVWFILPFVVGYTYSVFVNPVLQRSVLIFSFPFLIFLVFSFVKDTSRSSPKLIMTIGLLVFGVVNTVYSQSFYQTNFFGVLKEIVQKSIDSVERYGGQNITMTVNVGHPHFINYYLDRYDKQIDFIPFRTDSYHLKYVNYGRQDLMKMIDIVDAAKTEYFSYCWSSGYSPSEIPEIIQDKYPCILQRTYYFNSEYYLFGRETTNVCVNNDQVFLLLNDFDKEETEWTKSGVGRMDSSGLNGSFGYQFTSEIEFGPTLEMKVKDLFNATDNLIHTSLWVNLENKQTDAIMVITLESPSKVYEWRGMNLSYFIKNEGEWAKCYHSWRFKHIRSKEDLIKVYVWNVGRESFVIDNFQVKVNEGNPIIFGKEDHSL
ncbi:MAG: hypothetical protein COB85_00340 [Bacteroidetes bacterium]|nr:MAG: hypothetical protein COB85_00340 [Bacteroidota bacterium]